MVLEIFLRLEPLALEHVEEVGVAAEVQLVGALELARRGRWNRRVSMRWTIVAPTCDLMSSPMIGRPRLLEAAAPVLLAGDEDRDAVDEARSRPASACSTYHLVASSEPTGRYVTTHVGLRSP